ncbi:MAG: LLM class F420-dependent oxidoreductase [Actinomycetota bacterium]|nr:LLM class F420-dependent oxidoreductase [Actinomycetota bacterium]
MSYRLGITVPALPLDVRASCAFARDAEALGYSDAWSMEASGTDGFSVAAAVGVMTETIRVGCAIVPVFTRPPALIAMSASSAQQASAGRFCLGLGASSPTIVDRWMGMHYERPLTRVDETVEAVRSALRGEKVDYDGRTLSVRGFRLDSPPSQPVPIFLAALGPKMLQLAREKADGILLFLAAEEGVRIARRAAPESELVSRMCCFVDEDPEEARAFARWLLSPYLLVEGYNNFVARQGFEEEAARVVKAWAAGDRDGARAAFSDRLADALVISGSPGECRERIASLREAGLDTPVLMFLSRKGPEAIASAMRSLAP